MREKHLIIVVFEGNLKRESIIKAATLLFHAVLVIAYIVAVPLPSQATFIIRFNFWIYEGFHTLVVTAFWFNEVYNVELIWNVFACVLHLEEKPLSVVICAIVILQDEIILELPDLNSSSQITRFKSAFEDKCSVRWILLHIIWF
jgi:hypothetical protein